MEHNTPKKCKLLKIVDGDTFYAETIPEGYQIEIRMSSIDAPELNQPNGWKARYSLYKMMEKNNFEFYATHLVTGEAGRVIADVYPNLESAEQKRTAQSFNYKLCEEGAAWYYVLNGKNTSTKTAQIKSAQSIAASEGAGVWDTKKQPVHPAVWRRDKLKMGLFESMIESHKKKKFLKENNLTMEDLERTVPFKKPVAVQPVSKENNLSSPSAKELLDTTTKELTGEKTPEINSYARNPDAAPNAEDLHNRNLEKLKNEMLANKENSTISEKIKRATEEMSANLAKGTESQRQRDQELSALKSSLKNEETKSKMGVFLAERSERLKKIPSEEVLVSEQKSLAQEEASKKNLSKLKASDAENIDKTFDIESLDLEGLDFDDVDPNQSMVSETLAPLDAKEISEQDMSNSGYDPENMNYSSNETGFTNQVAPQEPTSQMENNDMPPMDVPPLGSYDDYIPDNDYDDDYIPDNDYIPDIEYDNVSIPDFDLEDSETSNQTKNKSSNRTKLKRS